MKKIYICLSIVVVAVAFYGCSGSGHQHEHKMPPLSAMSSMPLSGEVDGAVRKINVKAFQFAFDPATIVVKKGEKVRMAVKSSDVMHGIAIDAFDINRKLPPGKEVVIEFTPDRAGVFPFYCSVYCGAGHGQMHGMLVVKE